MLRKWKHAVAGIVCGLCVAGTASANAVTNHTAIDNFLSDQPAGSTSTYYAPPAPSGEGEWNDPFGTGFRRQLVASNGISAGSMVFPSLNPILQYTNSTADLSAFDLFYFDLSRDVTGPTFFDFSVRSGSSVINYSLSFENSDLVALPSDPVRWYMPFSDFEELALLGGNPAIDWADINRFGFGARNLTLHEWGVANFDTQAVVPVPPAAAMILIGFAGLGLHRKRMSAKK
jgi:hypothetical protein